MRRELCVTKLRSQVVTLCGDKNSDYRTSHIGKLRAFIFEEPLFLMIYSNTQQP